MNATRIGVGTAEYVAVLPDGVELPAELAPIREPVDFARWGSPRGRLSYESGSC